MVAEATKAFDEKDLTLPGGKVLHLTPLTIKPLREFMRVWGEWMEYIRKTAASMENEEESPSEAELTEKQFDVYEKLLHIALKHVLEDDEDVNVNDKKAVQEFIDKKVDQESMAVIFKYTGGLSINSDDSPNQNQGTPVA